MAQSQKSTKQQIVLSEKQGPYVGWIFFASIMLFILGGLHLISGFIAVFSNTLAILSGGHLVAFNYETWGWLHVAIGALFMGAAGALLLGKTWARVLTIALAVVSALVNIAYLPVYPIWSIIALTIDGFVIYAVAMHSVEIKQ